jgi:hypothetical protein
MVMAQIELQQVFGRVHPVSDMSTMNQVGDDLGDLARDHPDQPRFAVVVDLARDDQISKIARAMGEARFYDLVREASGAPRSTLVHPE